MSPNDWFLHIRTRNSRLSSESITQEILFDIENYFIKSFPVKGTNQ